MDFNKLYIVYHDKFVRFANRYVRNLLVAEDITTDALIYYWENKNKLPDNTNAPAYILVTIKNKCLSHLHHLEIHENVTSQLRSNIEWELSNRIARLESFEPHEIFTEEIVKLVNKTLRSLPKQTREIFLLSRKEYLSHKEIAQKLNLSTKSVEFHISKVIKVLRIELKDYFPIVLILIL
ncbi:DNA-directed RNA polymerase sigma-70 factor [Bacteroidia bacterium]|nr:DNA-directed RNA polymerase sigma-70 factor [Bacteroidia bacterium]